MKKFLTVLLALSVVFTYSFSAVGTAFAASATAEDAEKAFLEVVADAEKALTFTGGYYDHNVDQLDGVISQAVIEERIAEVKKANIEEIYAAKENWDDVYPVDAQAFMNEVLGKDSKEVLDKQLKVDTALVVKSTDLNKRDYSAADWEKIEKEIKRIEAELNKQTESYTTGNVVNKANAINAIRGLSDDMEVFMKDNNIETIEGSADKVTAAKKDALKALDDASANFIEKSLVYFATKPLTATELAQKETLVKDVNSLVAVFEEEIERLAAVKTTDYTVVKAVIAATFAIGENRVNSTKEFYDDLKVLDTAALLKIYAESVADTMKQMRKEDGRLLYHTKDVDAAYADTLATIAEVTYDEIAGTAELDVTLVNNGMDNVPVATYALKQYKEDAIAAVKTGTYAASNWSFERKDKVEAIQAQAEEDILLAETREEVDAIELQAKADMNKILNNDQIDDLTYDAGKVIDALGYDALFDDYFDANVGTTGYTAATKAEAKAAAKEFLIDAVIDEEDALLTRTEITEIVKANYADALKVLNDAQTEEALKAAGEAVKKEIEALPKDITLDAKDAVLAALESYETFDAQFGAKDIYVGTKYINDLYDAVDDLVYLEVKEVKAMVSALPSKITVADESAVAAARKAVEAIEETYGEGTTPNITVRTVETAEAALEEAKVKDAADKIAALKDGATQAEVEAARAAYDALSIRSKLSFNDELYADLLKAEANVKANIIAGVKALQIKTSTKLYTKSNKIRVNWRVADGDASNIDGYQVYKSTKAHTNYKFMGKTKKSYMDNKLNLKKGTRYFYKVRAYVDVDGERYFSDWSNKGNRIYK